VAREYGSFEGFNVMWTKRKKRKFYHGMMNEKRVFETH